MAVRKIVKDPKRSLQGLKSHLSKIRFSIAHEVAQRAAPDMTTLARTDFDGGTTVYGAPRPRGIEGNALDLNDTGRTREILAFAASGRQIRALLLPYTKYLIAKYDILPNGPLPAKWKDNLGRILHETNVKDL